MESTIVGLDGEHLVVYRLGGITLENLTKNYPGIVRIQNHKAHTPNAPGMLPYHYAPKTKLTIVSDISLIPNDSIKTGIIYYSQDWASQFCTYAIRLDDKNNYASAGRNLYDSLYKLDSLKLDLIVIQKFPNSGLGRTINDRLARAEKRR